MPKQPTNLHQALESFTAEWTPYIVTQVNDYDVRVVKIRGEFVWHHHAETDEFFHVLAGEMSIALKDHPDGDRVVHLTSGSVFTVPKGVVHKPSSESGASVLLFEPSSTVNTGDTSTALPPHIHSTRGELLGS